MMRILRNRGTSMTLGVVALAFATAVAPAPARAQQQQTARPANSSLLTQVQAADVLADLITFTVPRAEARVANMQAYLRETGKLAAFDAQAGAAGADAAPNNLVPFSAIFQGAVLFVTQGDGAKYADPSLGALTEAQLPAELTELQVYNIEQFQKLNRSAKAVSSMTAFLKSAGELEKYRAWAKEKGLALPTPPTTPQEVAARMEEMIRSSKEIAWAKAQARGMSQEEFERRWGEQVKQYQQSVEQKVLGVRSLANTLIKPPPPPPAPPGNPPPVYVGAPPGLRGGPSLPTPGQSQYSPNNTAASFQQRNDELWNRFDDD